jgi:hypothetical protein
MARSVISVTTRRRCRAWATTGARSAGQGTRQAVGSMLTNSVSPGSKSAASAVRYAEARHTQSSSSSRPALRAAENSIAGDSQRVPAGPRLNAS